MSITDSQARIKAQMWQAIAQSDVDTSTIPKPTLDHLVNLLADAVLVDMDTQLGESVKGLGGEPAGLQDDSDERLLWEGRPFLSLNKRYLITTERVRIIEGMFGKSKEDIDLIRIQDIDQHQTVSERLFSVGDVTIRSQDSSHPAVVLNNVKDPEMVHEILRRAVLKAREKYRLTYREEL